MATTDEKQTAGTDREQTSDIAGTDGSGESNSIPAQQGKPAEDDTPSRWSLIIIFLALFLALVCVGLDRAIVATAVPEITVEFDSLEDVGWYGSAFLLTMCCFQLLFGKLYANFNIKWVFLVALGIFEVGSVVCAAAPSSAALIIGRAVAGIGGAGLLSGGLIIISQTVPVDRRPKYTGALGGSVGISQIVAPTLGGVFTDRLTWRWCFWINLPLGGVTLLVVLFFVRLPTSANRTRPTIREFVDKFDLAGTLVLMPWIVCLLFALQWGGTRYAWGSWRIILLLALFAVLFVAWVAVQIYQGDKATLPMRIMKERSMISGVSYMFIEFAQYFLVIYYVPIWFQAVRNVSAYQSGINFLTTSAATSVMVVLSGQLTSWTGYYVPQMIAGGVISAVGCGLMYTFDQDTSNGFWIATLIVLGIGFGLGVQQPVVSTQTILKGPDIALGTSALMFGQSLSSTVFLCVGQNVFSNLLVQQVERLAPGVDDPQVVVDVGAADIHDAIGEQYPGSLDAVITAYNNAVQRVFLIALVLSCLSVPAALGMEWVNVKKVRQKELEVRTNGETPGSSEPRQKDQGSA